MIAKVAKKVVKVFLILEEGSFSCFLSTSFWSVVEIKIQWRRTKKNPHPTKWNRKNKNSPPYRARRQRLPFVFLFFIEKPYALSFSWSLALCCCWELCSTRSRAALLHCPQNQQFCVPIISLQTGLARGARASFDDIIIAVTLVAHG